jgi:hypothetical protein
MRCVWECHSSFTTLPDPRQQTTDINYLLVLALGAIQLNVLPSSPNKPSFDWYQQNHVRQLSFETHYQELVFVDHDTSALLHDSNAMYLQKLKSEPRYLLHSRL